MNYYKDKIIKKILKRSTDILFIGSDRVSFDLCLSFVNKGFNVYYCYGDQLEKKDYLIERGVIFTDFSYDFYNADVVFLFPSLNEIAENELTNIAKYTEVINKMNYYGVTLLFHISNLTDIYYKKIEKKIEDTVYLDNAAPVVEPLINGKNYFMCIFNKTDKKVNSEKDDFYFYSKVSESDEIINLLISSININIKNIS